MIEAVVFDLDGTLLDTIEDIADSVNYALKTYELPILGYEDCKKFVGDGALHLCEKSLNISKANCRNSMTCQFPGAEDILGLYREHYAVNSKNKTKPYKGIGNELILIQKAGIPMSIISNKPERFTKELVEEYFPEIRFRYVIGESKLFLKKPDPESLKFVMNKMHVEPQKTAYVGDSEIDIYTAAAAKAIPVGVLWGFRDKRILGEAGAKILIEKVEDLYNDLIGRKIP